MRPQDLQHLVLPSDPQLHPDGRRVAFVLSELDVEDDRTLRTIHLFDGVRTRRFTHGPSDSLPRWSPDGSCLAFLRTGVEEGERPQLVLMPADGGEAQRRTELPLGVSDFAWSPDGRQLVLVAARWVDEVADLDDDERRRRPKRITRLPYRTDAGGWVHDRTVHLWLVDRDGTEPPRQLTTVARDHREPAWRPDGRAIAFVARPEDGDELDPHVQVFELDLDTGDVRPLLAPGAWSWVGWSPDGRLFALGHVDPFDWPGTHDVFWCRPTDDGAYPFAPVELLASLDRDVLPGAPGTSTVGPQFVAGGFHLALEDRGTTKVVHVDLDGWDPDGDTPPSVRDVVGGRRSVTGFGVRRDASALVFTVTDPATPGELVWSHDGRERNLTDLTPGFRARSRILPTQRFTFVREDAEIDAWAVLPDGFDEAAPGTVPLLINIHGGPTSQYGDYFFDEFQVEAGAGYLAVGSNPRGSSGRGADWARAVVGAWTDHGSVDTLDLEALVDATLERFPQADPDRIGIMGGSYGGYATARLLARSDRYRSAIVERGLLQWESFSGTSDIGPYFDRMFLSASLPDGVEAHRAASPVGTASSVTAPTLVLHSEADHRCPIEQGEQYFVALKRAGVTTEMVRFPDETHELSRSGSPKHRIERFEVVLDWHARHLLGAADPDGDPATVAPGSPRV
ncbi:S9 family peptidase [Egicoccus halophilus]|uniref:Putative peptidase YuxL n=1 Tax=Egicoccus halophilus TaxID=1670830 RepID=A0A8J3AGH4_9ACTN|nr:S9 family peptidase [Egicoccus halophilus]GGI07808.1 putative peptidase YuxL [Egicoccus halophilus]